MLRASEIVLAGFALRSDVKLVRYPERYMDDRGVAMWDTVWEPMEQKNTELCACHMLASSRLRFQLIGAMAEFERALIQERKEDGLEGT